MKNNRITHWVCEVRHPSGESQIFQIDTSQSSSIEMGSHENAQIRLNDLKLSHGDLEPISLTFSEEKRNLWIQIPIEFPAAKISDIFIRSGEIPWDQWITIGDSLLRFRICEATETLETTPNPPLGVKPWLTKSPSGVQLLWSLKKSAESPLPVYLCGETGVGKEILARLVHVWSPRASGPFIPINCGALVETLAESELFGHTKGAFTGADRPRAGALLQAHNGTLFLDEIAELTLDLQVKLLRFLENGEIRAVGSDRSTHAQVRIVCATHQPLEKLVEAGRFRKDLYYRLSSIELNIPPLRDRPEDIPYLARQFAREHGREISTPALLFLKRFCWQGNVRQLRHSIERAVAFAGPLQPILLESDFSFLKATQPLEKIPELVPLFSIKEMERILLLRALQVAEGNRTEAAKLLGVARSTLFEMLKRYRIKGPRSRLTNGESREIDVFNFTRFKPAV